ncbi:hypothetical protein FSARC_12429 [Fusarium sarcochroum]|uniref:Zn(2)-C6 fungal-type domain-containing protein n=1 Tax=Fusarium sarcochroum TaxID=1208366 RepID=A0A8H4T8K5_9HYPO|nr:hypothetical protein FSARC_12429 [Fusarium sarcochroum]
MPSFLSMRASCDRCRFHKLKCNIKSESSPSSYKCTRCIRAKVECTYSQRARAKRQQTPIHEDAGQAPGRENASPSSPSIGSPIVEEQDNLRVLERPSISSPDVWSMLGDPSYWGTLDDPVSTLNSFAQAESAGQEATLSELDVSYTSNTSFSRSISSPNKQQVGQDIKFDSSTNFSSFIQEPPQPQIQENFDKYLDSPVIQLSNLVADIHKTLVLLTAQFHGSKRFDFSFHEYPIGKILHLAQEFVDIVTKAKMAHETTFPGPSIFESHSAFTDDTIEVLDNKSSSAISSCFDLDFCPELKDPSPPSSLTSPGLEKEVVDTPTTILAMGCYFSLRRLYCLVFTHLERYLIISDHGPPTYALVEHNFPATRNLQLGEMPAADDLCSRINTAVKLVLEALHSAESALELPVTAEYSPEFQSMGLYGQSLPTFLAGQGPDDAASLYNELGEAFSDNFTTGRNSCLRGERDRLHDKVQSVKRMLRERMGLSN